MLKDKLISNLDDILIVEIQGEPPILPRFSESGRTEISGLEVERIVSTVHKGASIRIKVRNLRDTPVFLERIIVLSCSVLAPPEISKSLKVFRLARQKNDIPGMFRPAINDVKSEDAAFDSSEISAGFGIVDGAEPGEKGAFSKFNADPGMIIVNDECLDEPPLFSGFTGQSLHLNEVSFTVPDNRGSLENFKVSAEFYGVRVNPGETRRTHEFVIQQGASEQDLLDMHVERTAELYKVNSDRQIPPAVYCTWYFYSFTFTEKDLEENLEEIQRKKLPFDVFQIDNGWMDSFGDWNADRGKFPSGMRKIADRIRKTGLMPGIWTCPFVLHKESEAVKINPDMILRNRSGSPCIFVAENRDCFVLDPYSAGGEKYLAEVFGRLKKWGYTYHKMDFLRAVLQGDAVFADPGRNCAEAYRHGLTLIRNALGNDSFISACGGLFEGSAGLVDSNRSGMDVQGHWDRGKTNRQNYTVRIKQNIARKAYNRLWHTDPDALQLRRREEGWPGNETHEHVTIGLFSDEQAFSIVVNQFLAGGLMCASDKLSELHLDRMQLYRHVLPQNAPPARYFDRWNDYLPELYATAFPNPGNGLPPWVMVSLANWNCNASKTIGFSLEDVPGLPRGHNNYAAFEFFSQKYLGAFAENGLISLDVPAHGCRVVRLCAWENIHPVLIGTDMNLSSGTELKDWKIRGDEISCKIDHPWAMPINISLLMPSSRGGDIRIYAIPPDSGNFSAMHSRL